MSPASCQVVRKRSPTPALGAVEGGRRLGVSLVSSLAGKHEGWGISIPHNALYSLQMEKGGPAPLPGSSPSQGGRLFKALHFYHPASQAWSWPWPASGGILEGI